MGWLGILYRRNVCTYTYTVYDVSVKKRDYGNNQT